MWIVFLAAALVYEIWWLLFAFACGASLFICRYLYNIGTYASWEYCVEPDVIWLVNSRFVKKKKKTMVYMNLIKLVHSQRFDKNFKSKCISMMMRDMSIWIHTIIHFLADFCLFQFGFVNQRFSLSLVCRFLPIQQPCRFSNTKTLPTPSLP